MKQIQGALLALIMVWATGCPKDRPPQPSEICTLDGVGGADCADPGEAHIYRSPAELTNYWATTQNDAVNLFSWCYGVPKPQAAQMVRQYVARYEGGVSQ